MEMVHRVLRPALNDNEITVKFWEIAPGQQRYVAGDEQYIRERGSRIFASSYSVSQTRLRDEQEVQHDRRARRPCAGAYRILAARQGPELHRQGRVYRRRSQAALARASCQRAPGRRRTRPSVWEDTTESKHDETASGRRGDLLFSGCKGGDSEDLIRKISQANDKVVACKSEANELKVQVAGLSASSPRLPRPTGCNSMIPRFSI